MLTDLRRAGRALGIDRSSTLLSTIVLALTIGTSVAVYAAVDAIVLRPFAFERQDRTVVIWQADLRRDAPVVEVALGEVETWRREAQSFESLAVFGSVNWPLTIIDRDARSRVASASVSSSFFTVVGIPPLLGRVLGAGDELGHDVRTAVISHAFWQQRYGGDPGAVGRILTVQEEPDAPRRPVEIVGVMPAGFDFPRGAQLWLPAAPGMRAIGQRLIQDPEWFVAHFRVFYALGRLRADVAPEAARQELTAVSRELGATIESEPPEAVVTRADDYLLGPSKSVLWTLLGGAALMLAVACANIGGLHVFRFARNDRALAIQLALGASRSRLIGETLLQSALLTGLGAAGAAIVASVVVRLLVLAAPVDVPRLAAVTLLDPRVLVATIALAAVTVAACGFWPAVFAARLDEGRVLAHGARAAMHARERRLQRLVVGSQVAAAVVLLAGTVLFARSVQQLDRTALGFDPKNLLAVEIEPAASDLDRWDQFYDTLISRVEALPPVVSAAAVYLRPLSGPIGNDTRPVLAGQTDDSSWRGNALANLEPITPGYFGTLRTRLRKGRVFGPQDLPGSPGVVIVSESAAARYWPGRDPIGQQMLAATQRVQGAPEQPRWQTVVGVVEDVRYRGLTDPRLDLYVPALQSTNRVKHLMVRTTGDPLQVAGTIRDLALELDPQAHVAGVTTMDAEVAREAAPWRFAVRVLAVFGAVGAALAAVGLLALVSLVVALRRRELGIRLALGATPRRLRAEVLRDGLRTTAFGALAGVFGALVLGRAISSLLVDVRPDDPLAVVGAVVLAVAAGLAGCLLPAHRASVTDPARVLRE